MNKILVTSGSTALILSGLSWLAYSSFFSNNPTSGAIASSVLLCIAGLQLFVRHYKTSGPEMERLVRILFALSAILTAGFGSVGLAYFLFLAPQLHVWAILGSGSILIFALIDLKKGYIAG
jgi:hypothetical protein